LRVPPDQAEKSGLLPDQVKINEKYGGGFPANVEGLHHLHCLVRHPLVYHSLVMIFILMIHKRISSGSLYTIISTTTIRSAKELSETKTTFSESMFVSPHLGFPGKPKEVGNGTELTEAQLIA
jgi:Mycotoxin biosynthesis protein UstYa